MNIGILAPSIYMSTTYYKDMIFAPRDLCISLVDGLVKNGHTVYFFTSHDVSSHASLIAGDISLLKSAFEVEKTAVNRSGWSSFFSKKRFYELDLIQKCLGMSKSLKLDIIHSYHDFCAHYFDSFSDVPIVYTQHDSLTLHDKKGGYSVFSRFPDHAYVAISDAQRRVDSIGLSFISTVYHGISTNTYVFSDVRGMYCACMARLIPEKGIHDAIQVAHQTEVSLQIATSMDEVGLDSAYLQSKIQPHISDKVAIVGFMGEEKKQVFLGNAFCFLFPIHWEEPFGMVMIESMACGTPVIAYNRGSVPEVLVDGVTGFIIDPPVGDDTPYPLGQQTIKKRGVDGLCEAIMRLKSMSEGEYRVMRQNCRKHVEEKFTVEHMVKGYEQVYTRILASKGQALRS